MRSGYEAAKICARRPAVALLAQTLIPGDCRQDVILMFIEISLLSIPGALVRHIYEGMLPRHESCSRPSVACHCSASMDELR
jgi:hypothetical protein